MAVSMLVCFGDSVESLGFAVLDYRSLRVWGALFAGARSSSGSDSGGGVAAVAAESAEVWVWRQGKRCLRLCGERVGGVECEKCG